MKYRFSMTKKIMISLAATFVTHFTNAQTIAEGINSIDSHKYAKAKEIFSQIATKAPTAENFYYLGYAYLVQFQPDFDKAKEYFDKGLSLESKSYLNRVGLASIKLGKGQKTTAINELNQIAKDSREKDAEVLYRIGEALTVYETSNEPTLAITYLNKAIERAQKEGVPAYYYYTLGDAYRLVKDPGNAMTAYDRASEVAKSKASVFYRMATLWMAAKNFKSADENIKKAIAVDPTYAPAYMAQAQYNQIFQKSNETIKSLENYTQYADEDPGTILEIAIEYFNSRDYEKAKATLYKVFDKITANKKHQLKAYLLYKEGDYLNAKTELETYFSKIEPTQIKSSDYGLEALIYAGLSSKESNPETKNSLLLKANEKLAVVKTAKDTALDWESEFANAVSGAGDLQRKILEGPTNETIENLKKQVAAQKDDTTALFNLALAYQEANNWYGAADTWQKMNDLLPTWEPAFYNKAYSLQKVGYHELAVVAFQKYLNLALTKTADEQKTMQETIFGAYYSIALLVRNSDKPRAIEALNKAIELNPTDKNVLILQKELNK